MVIPVVVVANPNKAYEARCALPKWGCWENVPLVNGGAVGTPFVNGYGATPSEAVDNCLRRIGEVVVWASAEGGGR